MKLSINSHSDLCIFLVYWTECTFRYSPRIFGGSRHVDSNKGNLGKSLRKTFITE